MSGYEEALKSISLDADPSLGIYTGVPGLPGSASPNYGKMFHFVKVTGKHQVGLATAATDGVVGILQNKPQQAGGAATVGIFGVSQVICGGTINAGDLVAPDNQGRAVTDGTNGRWRALEPGVVGTTIAVLKV